MPALKYVTLAVSKGIVAEISRLLSFQRETAIPRFVTSALCLYDSTAVTKIRTITNVTL